MLYTNIPLSFAAETVRQKLQEMDVFRASKNVSIYISMPNSEIITTDIIHDLLKSGKHGRQHLGQRCLHGRP